MDTIPDKIESPTNVHQYLIQLRNNPLIQTLFSLTNYNGLVAMSPIKAIGLICEEGYIYDNESYEKLIQLNLYLINKLNRDQIELGFIFDIVELYNLELGTINNISPEVKKDLGLNILDIKDAVRLLLVFYVINVNVAV